MKTSLWNQFFLMIKRKKMNRSKIYKRKIKRGIKIKSKRVVTNMNLFIKF